MSIAEDSPKSSFTVSSAAALPEDSEEDFPRNSQREDRARPCCGRADVAWFGGGGPNTCFEQLSV